MTYEKALLASRAAVSTLYEEAKKRALEVNKNPINTQVRQLLEEAVAKDTQTAWAKALELMRETEPDDAIEACEDALETLGIRNALAYL